MENKLNSRNPVLIAQVFSELFKNISRNKNKKAFLYLKDTCLNSDPKINDVAISVLVKCIETGQYNLNEILEDFYSFISTVSDIKPLIKVFSELLRLQLKRTVDIKHSYTKFAIIQHPLIKILQQNCHCETQLNIYKGIVRNYSSNVSLENLETLYTPLYLYCVCSPVFKIELCLLRNKLWTWMLNIDKINGSLLTYKLCGWLQFQNVKMTEITGMLLEEALHSNIESSLDQVNSFLLLDILVCYNMISNDINSSLTLQFLHAVIRDVEFYHCNLALVIFSNAILSCSSLCLMELLQLCFELLRSKTCSLYSFLALKSSLLLWLGSPSVLTGSALKLAEQILLLEHKVPKEKASVSKSNINNLDYLIYCNPDLFLSRQLEIKIENTTKAFSLWLDELTEAPEYFIKHIFTTLCGFLHCKSININDKIKILSLLSKCCSVYAELCPALLNNVLHLLSINTHPQFTFKLLDTLPVLAQEKENVPQILATIQAIGKDSIPLLCVARRLIYKLWEVDNKCYSNLESLLILEKKHHTEMDILEDNVSKAFILKLLAEKRPELYGRDLVAHFSKILNECFTVQGSIPTALAIEGIKHLCKAEVVDFVRTWATLSPKFGEETRVPVIKSVCSLLSEIPHLAYTEAYETFNNEVVQYLWRLMVNSENAEITDAAARALAEFKLDLICSCMPGEFLDEKAQDTSIIPQRTVSGKTWLNFLTRSRTRKAATTFLIKLVSTEICNYLKYVYHVKKQREPDNYAALPTNSLVKVLGQYVKANSTKVNEWKGTENEEVYICCLEILSQEYSKPLPPLNWCFLQELIHKPELTSYCVDIACHQAILSGSARRLIENYIVAITETMDSKMFITIYKNLKYLAKSIQPMLLKPFIETSLQYALVNAAKGSQFENLLPYLASVLEDSTIQSSNKHVIESVLNELIQIVDLSSREFILILNCLNSFSEAGLEPVTKFNQTRFDERDFLKKTKIRCDIATKRTCEKPLKWLNDIFDVAFENNIHPELFMDYVSVSLKKNASHPNSPDWLLELFGTIQVKVADRCAEKEISYYCEILAVAITCFSGLSTLITRHDRKQIMYYFPAAVTFLFQELSEWDKHISQILEWFYHMNTTENVPKEFRKIFGWTVCALRHTDEFSRNYKWMKYLDCEIYTDTNKVIY